MGVTLSHLGICVSDLDRSVRFYCDGLGFELVQSHTVGDEFGRLMELEDVVLQSRFVRRDGVSVELLHFDSPGTSGEPVRRPMNQLGITHLSLRVDDLDDVAATIESFGGTVLTGTRTTFGSTDASLDFVYCTDPDGVRIELMRLPG
ncbi:MAG TPA: VOC family protein [Acidimicrobiales bacterium]|nr:VOC family protein [Acidimicrobiales bacterium]